jgi:coenzyme Q-binding protein COQ10
MPTTHFIPRAHTLRLLPPPTRHSKRTFLSSFLPSSSPPPQTLTASRRLPYNHKALYGVIADIDSYSAFLPYCSSSRVTSWTAQPDPDFGRRWPTRADLTAGWGGLEQTYTSRVNCVPGSIVEALSGEGARSGIAPNILAKYGLADNETPSIRSSPGPSPVGSGRNEGGEGVFKTLVTRWTVTPAANAQNPDRREGTIGRPGKQTEWSDVHLNIHFQFANPLYGAVSSAVADKIAPIMIEAFVERAKKILQ